MKIDIDKLTESELIDLNNRIVQRLRFLQQMRAHSAMLEFSVGERVCFHPEGRDVIYGVLTRYNKKTVTVITESGEHWNVLLRRFVRRARRQSRWARTMLFRSTGSDGYMAAPNKRFEATRGSPLAPQAKRSAS